MSPFSNMAAAVLFGIIISRSYCQPEQCLTAWMILTTVKIGYIAYKNGHVQAVEFRPNPLDDVVTGHLSCCLFSWTQHCVT